MASCPTRGKRRQRADAVSESTVAEELPSNPRLRTQPPDVLAPEPGSVATTATASTEHEGPSGDLTTRQDRPESTSQQDQLKAALLARAMIKFSGKSQGVVASGITADPATAEKPTYGHARAPMEVVFNDLDNALYDPHTEHRPCGVLDRYEAVGMLIGDACGLPSMPARPHGLSVGNKARKLPPKIAAEIAAAQKRAKRSGEDVAEAEAAVLRLPAGLKLPSAAECAAAAAAPDPEVEAAPPAPEPPPAAPLPTQSPSELLQPPPLPPLPPPTHHYPPPPPSAHKQIKRLFGSLEAAEAIYSNTRTNTGRTLLRDTRTVPTRSAC